jgi:predicted ATPase
MTIEFTPLTVLIGANSCGKTTILQALDFLLSAAKRDIPEYLRERDWTFEELKSKTGDSQEKPIVFISEFQFTIDNEIITLVWDFSVDTNKAGWKIKEKTKINDGKPWNHFAIEVIDGRPGMKPKLLCQASMLKYIEPPEKEIKKLKEFLVSSTYYGLLSPNTIRLGKRSSGLVGNIGNAGEWLSTFIHRLNEDDKNTLEKIVSDFLEIDIRIKTIETGASVALFINEKYIGKELEVDAWHSSDGFLRIIALAAITFERQILKHGESDGGTEIKADGSYKFSGYTDCNNGMILLDEIENGINPHLTEKAVDLLRRIIETTERQVIITTHSPVILNDFSPEEIVYLWKKNDGSVHCKKMFSTEQMREALEFLNPGEIWENFGKDAILQKLQIYEDNK